MYLFFIIESIIDYLRSTFHLHGANVLHAILHNVLAAGSELPPPALVVLLVVNSDLVENTEEFNYMCHHMP